ncbi:alpha/beta hydrolase fold protein [Mycolicibacterium vaccae ATCC 25954]|uniref:Alpha/beta hydrolase fold protein n=2 Tax=Mycolicibacterium vaccae TaxID=1810 RepID=K0UHX8_MYCVA|nr:alpha/beta hydrolase [Mycolicibacterium vaccae 95051]EJZ06411.1 alpha/beta hydrolase fold protein [Mycolicibacterium vaccae ATCC 25954]
MDTPTDYFPSMTTRDDVRIPARGGEIAAYLYRPQVSDRPAPCVVMAHGFTGTRDDGLPGYAEAFCGAGYAVALFDYRHFGASTGEPRQLLDIAEQRRDYHSVIAWARHLDGVDPDRLVAWGTSFSGGHVLAVAAEDPQIAAVIAQAPFTDALATLREIPPRNIPRVMLAAVRDQLGAWRGQPPYTVPAVGEPGTVAAMTSLDAKPGFEAMIGPNSLWRNEFAARLMFRFAFCRPGRAAAKLPMPVLLCVCDDDVVTPPGPSVTAARHAPRGELRRYPYGHFDIYNDPQVKADQLAFLARAVGDGSA